jgi:transcriptional regulator with XRE-family HTH domain
MIREPNIHAVMERLAKSLKITQDKELAEALGMSASNLSNRKRTESIPWENVCHLCISRGVNIDWVLTGEGSAFVNRDEWIQVPDVDPALMGEIAGELASAFQAGDAAALHAAAQRGALAAQIYTSVASLPEGARSAAIRDQARMLSEAARWFRTDAQKSD